MEAIRDFVAQQIIEAEESNNLQVPRNLSHDIRKILGKFEIACYCKGFSDGVMFNSGDMIF